jgi:hypothetical protein
MKCTRLVTNRSSRETSQIWQYVLQSKGAIVLGLMALDRLEPVEKFPIKIGGENTHLSIIVSVLSVGIPTTSNVVATTAIAPRIIASITFVILI